MPVSKWLGVAAGACLPLALLFSGALGQAEPDPATEVPRVAGVYEASAEALEKMRAQLPAEIFDVAALAKTLEGKSPQEITDWVGGHVQLVAYRGVLKGAQGALEDQRGNALDRALLLADLLKANGAEVRLARAELSEDQVAALAGAVEGAAPPPPVAEIPDSQPIVEAYYADPRVDGPRVRARNEREQAAGAAQHADANRRIETISARLKEQTAAMAAANAEAAAAGRRAALGDHWWVQVEVGGGWTDLDPAAGVLGTLSAAETYAPDQVPAELRRTVTVRIVAELSRDGTLGRETLLSHDLDPAAMSGRVLILRHRALDLRSMDAIFAEGGDFNANVVTAVTASSAWTPMLAVGDEVFTDKLVATNGDVMDATEANMALHGGQGGDGAAGLGGAIGGAIGGLDELSGDGPYDENTGPVKFTAQFIEIETRSPGESPRLERRALFDAIGPAARARRDASGEITDAARAARGFALLDSVEIMVTTGRLSPARAAGRIQESYAAAFRATAAWIAAGDGASKPELPDGFRHVNLPLNAFAAGRMNLGPDGDKRVQTDANAAMTRQGLRPSADGHSLSDVIVFDIVTNRVAIGGGVTSGVTDTIAEHVALGSPNSSRNAAIRYAQAIERGETWTLIEAGNTGALAGMNFDPDSAALVAEDLGRGYAVVVPQQVASLDDAVWWRIDPATGETLGMNAMGGSEMTEYTINLSIAAGNTAACMYKLAQAGKTPSTGKQIGIAMCLIGSVAGFAGAIGGTLTAFQMGALGGVANIAGGFADP